MNSTFPLLENPTVRAKIGDHQLDLSISQDEILNIGYQTTPTYEEDFDYLCESLLQKKINDIEKFSSWSGGKFKNIQSPALPCLTMALVEYKGFSPSISKIKAQNSSELLCRCFGYYKNEIEEFFKNGKKEGRLLARLEGCDAGMGCGSCRTQLSTIGFSYFTEKIGNLSIGEFVQKMEDVISSGQREEKIPNGEFFIQDFFNNSFEMKWLGEENLKEQFLITSMDVIRQEIGMKVAFS